MDAWVIALDKSGDLEDQLVPQSPASASWRLVFSAGQVASFGIAGSGDVIALDNTPPRSSRWEIVARGLSRR